jgi:hypothetical protein
MKKPDLIKVICMVIGEKASMFVSHWATDDDIYNVSFVKEKYAHIEKLQKLDTLILDGWKLRDLCKWVLNLKKGEWDSSEFFSSKDSLVLECNCHNEMLATYYDYESDIIYFEIFDNYWLKRKYRKKITSEFSICREDAQKSFKLLLNIFK